MQTKYFVVDHGRSQAFISKNLFVSKTDYKPSSRTLSWEVKTTSSLCLSIGTKPEQAPADTWEKEGCWEESKKPNPELFQTPQDMHIRHLFSLELNLAQVWSKYTLRTGQGQKNKHRVWKASFVASSLSQVCEQPVGCRAALLFMRFVCLSTWRRVDAWEVGQQLNTGVLANLSY